MQILCSAMDAKHISLIEHDVLAKMLFYKVLTKNDVPLKFRLCDL